MSTLVVCSTKSCKRPARPGKTLCERCARYGKKYRAQRIVAGLCCDCGKRPARVGGKTCSECRASRADYQKRNRTSLVSYRRYRDQVFDFYGRLCTCCGETEPMFLTIDHIHGRPEGESTGCGLYFSLAKAIKMGQPRTDVRVLCCNCNSGRFRNGGVCPHEANRA